jgi:hypothetical protein
MRRAFQIFLFLSLSFPALALSGGMLVRLNAGLFGLFGGNKQPPPGWMLRKQHIEMEGVQLKAADQTCENWSWVAGITDMAAIGGARMDQQYLVDRLYGGSVCLPSAGDFDELAHRISHDYVLLDGQKFRLQAQFTPGAPTQADPLIMSIRQSRPLMMIWRSHAYVLTGMDYDEYISPAGNRMFMVRALKLFDPIAEEGKHEVVFSREQDNPDDLNGVLELSVYSK